MPVEKVLQTDDIFQFFFGIKALAAAVANRLQEKGKFIFPVPDGVASDIGLAAYLANFIEYLVFKHNYTPSPRLSRQGRGEKGDYSFLSGRVINS